MDYRSYVSGAKNSQIKVILFFIFLFCFFSFSSSVFAYNYGDWVIEWASHDKHGTPFVITTASSVNDEYEIVIPLDVSTSSMTFGQSYFINFWARKPGFNYSYDKGSDAYVGWSVQNISFGCGDQSWVFSEFEQTRGFILDYTGGNFYIKITVSLVVRPTNNNTIVRFDPYCFYYLGVRELLDPPDSSTANIVGAVDNVNNTLQQEHQEEIDTANKANSDVSQGVGQVTDVLSSWEIFKLPVTVTSDLVTAITAEGSSSLTFPSFSLMGYELWPSYTFDLQYIAENFPVLYNALHTVTGIMIVGWFIHYLWRKWHILTGDDTPEGS